MSVLFQTYTMTGNMPYPVNYISQFGFPWTAASKTNQQRSSIIPGKETYCLRYISNICIISGKFRHKVQSIIDFDTFPGTKLNCSDTVPQPEAIQQVCALTDESTYPVFLCT